MEVASELVANEEVVAMSFDAHPKFVAATAWLKAKQTAFDATVVKIMFTMVLIELALQKAVEEAAGSMLIIDPRKSKLQALMELAQDSPATAINSTSFKRFVTGDTEVGIRGVHAKPVRFA